ncbi:MAG: sulfate adenylyltransferase [Burkholderiales bacterium]|nr:MAG: sulfate adenylyltransferase [Betaproteobacteria bacterium]TAG24888.1 MAG: sulfate adenylyltransferase [Burkholderiales bacterium]TAG50229.1 MAG: sulfate adenylyltransferase [Betaproteobacteria bacterium]TAG65293.1 MAG: sulfate adenylyltransferase [Burkholderiales bacterium]
MSNITISNGARPLRFITCGSVDDGKSTLIGRLLYDSNALMLDQLDALAAASRKRGGANASTDAIDLSLATDGLEAEREQGITIDVAYRYFATPKRKFIIADAPGHEQYTRNMVTGASKSDVAVVLIDVTKLDFSAQALELLPQTIRHAAIVGLLGLVHVVVAVNKMDAIDFDELKFERVVAAFTKLAQALSLPAFTAVPVSALHGDGIVIHTERTAWFKGPALLPLLESIDLDASSGAHEARTAALIAVQYVTRDALDDHRRWICGDLAGSALDVGTRIRAWPSGASAIVTAINTPRGATSSAACGEALSIALDRQLDVARGDWVIAETSERDEVQPVRCATATVAWLGNAPHTQSRRLLARHGTRWLPVRITRVFSRLDLNQGRWIELDESDSDRANEGVTTNDLVNVNIEFASELPLATFAACKALASFVLVDPSTNVTAGAGMISSVE